MERIVSIDITRGIVMIIMALDHVRDLLHKGSLTGSPTNLSTTTPILFFTRWITHICAPTFVFLAGTSAYLSLKKNNDLSATRRFLLKRGLYLLLLEFIVVNFALYFDPAFHTILFGVIAAIGFGFIVLALLLPLGPTVIGIVGLAIVFSHNLLTLFPFPDGSFAKTYLSLLFNPGMIPLSADRVFFVAYPPIPWVGIMLTGFAAGRMFEWSPERRKAAFIKIAVGAFVLFVALRVFNFYGDPAPWSQQPSTFYSFFSFINLTKYPPSLLFVLTMLGIMFLMLMFTESSNNKFSRIASVYGKVPLFYFVLHFFLIHLILLAVLLMQGFQWSDLPFHTGNFGRPADGASGVRLRFVFVIWIIVVAVLYLPCLWLGRYKSSHSQWWLKYI